MLGSAQGPGAMKRTLISFKLVFIALIIGIWLRGKLTASSASSVSGLMSSGFWEFLMLETDELHYCQTQR